MFSSVKQIGNVACHSFLLLAFASYLKSCSSLSSWLSTGSSCKSQLFASFDVKSSDLEDVEQISDVVDLLVATVQISNCFPQGLALELSLLESLAHFVGAKSRSRSWGLSTACLLNLLHKTLVFFVQHANVSLQTVSFTLHVAINLCPFVLLLASKLVLLRNQLPHLITLFEQISFFLLELLPQSATFSLESIRRKSSSATLVKLTRKFSDAIAHENVFRLESFVFFTEHALVVGISTSHVDLMVKALVQNADGVFLGLNLATVVVDHCVAFVLQTLVVRLGFHQLALQLLKLLVVARLASK